MSQNFCPVDSFPQERIIRHFVKLIPINFCCHKITDAALLHDLRKRRGIAKHIRKPQDFVFLSKFLLKETDSVEKLPDKRFSGCDVAIRFHKHAALRFPAPLRDKFLDLRVDLGRIFLHILIQQRLT